jgi:hypothetical protein
METFWSQYFFGGEGGIFNHPLVEDSHWKTLISTLTENETGCVSFSFGGEGGIFNHTLSEYSLWKM